MQYNQPILITGAERSGSTLITRVLQLCGGNLGKVNRMKENKSVRHLNHSFINKNSDGCFMPDLANIDFPLDWGLQIQNSLNGQLVTDKMPFVYKDSGIAQLWSLWHLAYPTAKWIIVRRRTGDIVHSCTETSYMRRFKDEQNQKKIGVETEREGWLWWVHEYEKRFVKIIQTKTIAYKVVWPERMRDGDFQQMQDVVEWCDLEWNPEVVRTMKKLLK